MKTPWHLWVVGIVSLLWNAGGGFDYYMSQTENPAYMAQLTPEQMNYFSSFPIWVELFWALGVWGAILGSILLLLRHRLALWSFVISFVGMIGNLIYGFFIAPTPMSELMGPAATMFSVAIVLVAAFLIWYARKMNMQGVLK